MLGARRCAPAMKSSPAPIDAKPTPGNALAARAAKISCFGAPRASRHSLAPEVLNCSIMPSAAGPEGSNPMGGARHAAITRSG